jgi:hypothetical protein
MQIAPVRDTPIAPKRLLAVYPGMMGFSSPNFLKLEHRRNAIGHAKLLHDIRHVLLYGLFANCQTFGNLTVG